MTIFKKILIIAATGFLAVSCSQQEKKPGQQIQSTPSQTTSPSTELEKFSWLVGDWRDDEEDLDVTFNWKWDLNHHFLVQEYNMKDADEGALFGTQVLGWDPIEKIYKSWTFDSDGGFGNSRWTESDNKWYVETNYTTAQGEVASATYVYTQLDKNSFSFASELREIDGDLLPDAGPYKFVRK